MVHQLAGTEPDILRHIQAVLYWHMIVEVDSRHKVGVVELRIVVLELHTVVDSLGLARTEWWRCKARHSLVHLKQALEDRSPVEHHKLPSKGDNKFVVLT